MKCRWLCRHNTHTYNSFPDCHQCWKHTTVQSVVDYALVMYPHWDVEVCMRHLNTTWTWILHRRCSEAVLIILKRLFSATATRWFDQDTRFVYLQNSSEYQKQHPSTSGAIFNMSWMWKNWDADTYKLNSSLESHEVDYVWSSVHKGESLGKRQKRVIAECDELH